MALVTKLVQGYSIKDFRPRGKRVLKQMGRKAIRSFGRQDIEAGLDEIIQERVQNEMDRRAAEREAEWASYEASQDCWDDNDYLERMAQMDLEARYFDNESGNYKDCDDPHCTICERTLD